MDVFSNPHFDLTIFMKVVFIDLVLSGDNAIIIGMAAAALPVSLRQRAIVWGICLAVILRIVLAALTVYLLSISGLKLIGGVLLFIVCYQLWKDLASDEKEAHEAAVAPSTGGVALVHSSGVISPAFMRAMATIIVADVSMSLDNVLGVAGAAKNNVTMLVFGLALSIVLMAIGANVVARLLNRFQWIGYIGLAVIVWVAAEMTFHGITEVHAYFVA